MSKPNLHISIGLLFHQAKVLVGLREENQHQGNKYEFPGGKVEDGETPEQACRREVHEEVGILLDQWYPFDFIRHEYDDVIVNLHLFHAAVPEQLLEKIQLPWWWYSRPELLDLNFPKANKAMVKRLYWHPQIKISADLAMVQQLSDAQLMYWRTDAGQQSHMALSEINVEQLPLLIINVELWKQLNTIQQQNIGAVHLKQEQLLQMNCNDLQVGQRYIAACHDEQSVRHAAKIGCDAVLLSPVLTTATHPDAEALGWKKFAQIAQQVDIPVFALGGMQPDMMLEAKEHYAYGLAGISFL